MVEQHGVLQARGIPNMNALLQTGEQLKTYHEIHVGWVIVV